MSEHNDGSKTARDWGKEASGKIIEHIQSPVVRKQAPCRTCGCTQDLRQGLQLCPCGCHSLDEISTDIITRAIQNATNAELERRRAAERALNDCQSDMEERVAEWVRTRIGELNMHRRERTMRLLEEAIELAQSEGITIDQVERQAQHVYGRPAGIPEQEAAGVAVCLLGWCAATGHKMNEIALGEIRRIEQKPIDQIRGSLARKHDADLVICIPGTGIDCGEQIDHAKRP